MATTSTAPSSSVSMAAASVPIVLALCFSHFLNDMVQALLPAIYPIIKKSYDLDFAHIGLLTLAFQLTASMLQPIVGILTDRHPQPFSLVAGMGSTLVGLLLLAHAGSYPMLLFGAMLIGMGSSIFHPEATRMARMASGGRHGFTQSLFQVGGQTGQAAGPLLAAFIIVPNGQQSLSWFSAAALLAMILLTRVGFWYRSQAPKPTKARQVGAMPVHGKLAPGVPLAIGILFLLMFSKNAYTASLTSYYTFYLMHKFGVAIQTSQLMLFIFLLAQVTGSLTGGYLGDRIGRRAIIWLSILGAVPFTLMLPFASLFWTAVLTIVIGFIMASAFPAIITFAIDMMPSRVGMTAGLFYGVSFGLGALSAAALGVIADMTSIETVYRACAFLPLLGLAAWFLPHFDEHKV
ncbi:MAG: MFS transporter [Hyphomicrobiaceae bacterium]